MLTVLLVMPLLGVLGVSISNSSENQKRIALGITLINFIISLVLWGQFDSSYNGFQFVQEFTSFCHLHVGIDGISLWFVLLTSFLIPMCLLASWESITVFVREFVIAFLVLETLLIGVFVVLDLLLFYIAFESVLIPMFLVIGVWGSRERKIHAAYYFFLFTLLGSLFMLLAVLVLYFSAGSSDYIVLATADLTETRQRAVWLGIFLAICGKSTNITFLCMATLCSYRSTDWWIDYFSWYLAKIGRLRVFTIFYRDSTRGFSLLYSFSICLIRN